MNSLDMNTIPTGYPEMPFDCSTCPDCQAINWIPGQSPFEISESSSEITICWRCHNKFWTYGFDENKYGSSNIADAINIAETVKGVPDPVIPSSVLQNLMDAAYEQYETLKLGVRSKEDDPDLVDIINELGHSINYIKELLSEGKLPFYNP